MIAFLRGKLINKNINSAIIEVNNIGYQVFMGESFLNELKLGQEVEVYLHQRIREDANDLYGFKTASDLELFELLITVSGVGPKSALGVLNIARAEDIKEAILQGDPSLLIKVSGIGKKTAERLVLELKTKIIPWGDKFANIKNHPGSSDELEALVSLGYSLSEAREALSLVDDKITDNGERVKLALQKLMKK